MRTQFSSDEDAGTAGRLAAAILDRPIAETARTVAQQRRRRGEWLYEDLCSCLGTGGRVSEMSECGSEGTTVYVVFEYTHYQRETAILHDTAKRISFIRSMLSLNVKEVAAALHVKRPSVYAWMGGAAHPKARNHRRIEAIWTLAREWGRLTSLPLGPLRTAADKDGMSIIELLMAAEIDTERVRRLMRAAASRAIADHAKPRRLGLRERAGQKGVTLATPPDAQRQIDLRTGKRISPE